MRHGLIHFDENELSAADIEARQDRLRAAMTEAGLDGLVAYTNHVRSAAVTWASGFTPYWSNGLWLLPREGAPYLVVALSPRVGGWASSTCPGTELAHSPKPGDLIGRRAARAGSRRLGVVEPARMPVDLVDQIHAAAEVELCDGTDVFAGVRAASDAAERRLLGRGADLARRAFRNLPEDRAQVGDVTGAVELAARLGGAEEVYMAAAPDLETDGRLGRVRGSTALGKRFALRATVARHGVWLRWARTYRRVGDGGAEADRWFEKLASGLAAGPGIAEALSAMTPPEGYRVTGWMVEAPVGTIPLTIVAGPGLTAERGHAAASLTVLLSGPDGAVVLAGPLTGEGGP